MDPQELERRKQEARDEGYSEEEINAALGIAAQPAQPGAQPVAPGGAYTPPPDQTVDRSAEQNSTLATGAAMGAAAAGIPAAVAYGLKRGVSAGTQAMDVAKQGINAIQEQNAVARAHQQLQYDKLAARGTVPGPVAPGPAPAAPAQPAMAAPAAAATEASQMSAARNIVQKLALSKILPAAQMAAGLFYTSPEEIAILKEAERRKKAGLQ